MKDLNEELEEPEKDWDGGIHEEKIHLVDVSKVVGDLAYVIMSAGYNTSNVLFLQRIAAVYEICEAPFLIQVLGTSGFIDVRGFE